MKTSVLSMDLRALPKWLFLAVLASYPFYAFAASKVLNLFSAKALGLVCILYLIYRCFEIYKTGANIIIPTYLKFFGLFTIYKLLSGIFISELFFLRGIKYFYSDSIWIAFMALLLVENVRFNEGPIKMSKYIIFGSLLVASVVSVVQISKPLFFLNDELLVQGLSVDRMVDYYTNTPDEMTGNVSRLMEGYRLSIYSYINELSIGIDTAAILSILLALTPKNVIKQGSATLAAVIVSVLSSSRWIMLNVIIVASQIFWNSKNKIKYFIYFIVISIAIVLLVGLVAKFMGLDIAMFIEERLMSDSAMTRFLAFEVFYEVFPDNPIFGTGGRDTEKMVRLLGGRSSQIHVGYLKLFYYYGLIGGLLYLGFALTLLRRLRKMARQSGYWGGFYAILAFFVANLTLFELSIFYYGPLLAIIFGNHFYYNRTNRIEATKPEISTLN
jgi:hypothetical protein